MSLDKNRFLMTPGAAPILLLALGEIRFFITLFVLSILGNPVGAALVTSMFHDTGVVVVASVESKGSLLEFPSNYPID